MEQSRRPEAEPRHTIGPHGDFANPRARTRGVAMPDKYLRSRRKGQAKEDLTQCDAISSSKNSANTELLCASKTKSCRNRSSRKHFSAK